MRLQHDPEAEEFSVSLAGGKAFIRYEKPDERTVDLLHTVVPPQEQSQGIGSQLVEQVFDYAREHNQRIIPSCPFVRSWLEDHPQYQDLVQNRTI